MLQTSGILHWWSFDKRYWWHLLWVWREPVSLGVVRKLFLGKPAPEKHNLDRSKFSCSMLTYPSSLTHRHEGWWNCHSRSQLHTPPPRESRGFQRCIFCKLMALGNILLVVHQYEEIFDGHLVQQSSVGPQRPDDFPNCTSQLLLPQTWNKLIELNYRKFGKGSRN